MTAETSDMSTPTASAPLSEERVREYEQMLAAVTPGPWTFSAHQPNPTTGDWLNFEDEHGVYPPLGEAGPVCETSGEANARFLAASPTIVRDLLADRDALAARVAALERDAARWRKLVRLVAENHMHRGLGGGVILASAPANEHDAAWASIQALDHQNPRNTLWMHEGASLDDAIDATSR